MKSKVSTHCLLSLALLLVFQQTAQSFTHRLILRGGPSSTWARLKTYQERGDEFLLGAGLSTHFSYRWNFWELGTSNYIFWGNAENLRFSAQQRDLYGEADFQSTSFGPLIRYFFKENALYQPHLQSHWHSYIGLGPIWSHQTIRFDSSETSESFKEKHKLTYSSFGFFITLGLEEKSYFKEMHPLYLELLYSFQKSKKFSLIDTTHPRQVKVILTKELQRNIDTHFVIFSIGATFF